jgi:hypothetical protein
MAIHITDHTMTLKVGDRVVATARFSEHADQIRSPSQRRPVAGSHADSRDIRAAACKPPSSPSRFHRSASTGTDRPGSA